MRQETSVNSEEKDKAAELIPNQSDTSAVDLAHAGPVPAAVSGEPGRLTTLMALAEPARTEALEKVVNSGLTVNLRSKTGQEVRWRYGEHVLVVTQTPKPFAAAHAIHLLFYASDQIEEVES